MKRKIMTVLLAICLLCSTVLLTSCENAEQLVNNAMEKTMALDSYSATMDMSLKMKVAGEEQNMSTTAEMKVMNAQSDNLTMSTDMRMQMLGETVNVSAYMADQWLYMNMGQMGKYKVKADSDMAADYNASEDMEDMMKELPADTLKEAEIKSASDGSKSVTVELDEEAFMELYDDMLDELDDSFESLAKMADMKLSIADAVITITVKDGYVTKYAMSFVMSVSVEGQTVSAEVDSVVTFHNPGTAVTVDAPANLDSYLSFDF